MNYLYKTAVLNKLYETRLAINYMIKSRFIKQATNDVMNKPIPVYTSNPYAISDDFKNWEFKNEIDGKTYYYGNAGDAQLHAENPEHPIKYHNHWRIYPEPDMQIMIPRGLPMQKYLPKPVQKYINRKRNMCSNILNGMGEAVFDVGMNFDYDSPIRTYSDRTRDFLYDAADKIDPSTEYKWILSPEAKKKTPSVIPD